MHITSFSTANTGNLLPAFDENLSHSERWATLGVTCFASTPLALKGIEKFTRLNFTRPQYLFITLAVFGFASAIRIMLTIPPKTKKRKTKPSPPAIIVAQDTKQLKKLEEENKKLKKENETLKKEKEEANKLATSYKTLQDTTQTAFETYKNENIKIHNTLKNQNEVLASALKKINEKKKT